MAKTRVIGSGGAAGADTIGTGATGFLPLFEGRPRQNTNESVIQAKWKVAGTFSNISLRIGSNATTSGSSINFRKGGVNGSQTVSFAAGATGLIEDTSHSDAVVSGDLVCYSLINGGGGSINYGAVASTFDATTNTVKRNGQGSSWGNLTGTLVTGYAGFGSGGIAAAEADAQFEFRGSGTIQNFQVNLDTNTRSVGDTSNYRIRKAGANLNSVCPTTAGVVALLEDTSHTDAIVSGDLLNFSCDQGAGTGNLRTRMVSFEYVTTDRTFQFAGGTALGATQLANLTRFIGMAGDAPGTATEDDLKMEADFAFTISQLEIKVITNTVSAQSDFKLRVNKANVTLTVPITSNTAGLYKDTSHSDAVVATDTLNYSLATGATGTSLVYTSFGCLATVPSASTVNSNFLLFF